MGRISIPLPDPNCAGNHPSPILRHLQLSRQESFSKPHWLIPTAPTCYPLHHFWDRLSTVRVCAPVSRFPHEPLGPVVQGQSKRLIIVRFMVRIHPGPPKLHFRYEIDDSSSLAPTDVLLPSRPLTTIFARSGRQLRFYGGHHSSYLEAVERSVALLADYSWKSA